MRSIIYGLLALLYASCSSMPRHTQTTIIAPQANLEVKDQYGNAQLLGKCNRSFLEKEPYRTWYTSGYEQYKTDQDAVAQLKPLLKKKKIEIFLGTWCGDSKREVPRMLKILDQAGVDSSLVQLIFVSNAANMYKQSPQHEEAGKQIKRVPTLILYENDKEIGRLVEYPVISLEKDLLAILRKQPYTPNYSTR